MLDPSFWSASLCDIMFKLSDWSRRVLTRSSFDALSLFCVLANSLLLMVQYYGMAHDTLALLNEFNVAFTGFYVVELV